MFWLRKMRDALRLQLMQYLNYESRAVRFWGLLDGVPMSSPGPLMDHIALGNTQNQLEAFFDSALESYSRSVRVVWLSDTHALGLLYKLSSAELDRLKMSDSMGEHTAYIRIEPDKTRDIFRDWTDTRLQEVRIWLFRVEIPQVDAAGRRLLSI